MVELAKKVSDEQTIIICIFRLNGLNRNLRNELKKAKKIYFYDNGVRNAVIQQFAPVSLRNDMGQLWENFFISERIKRNHYMGYHCNIYFWRTKSQQEIDYIEESDGQIAYDIKETAIVTPDNYLDWLI